MAPKGTLYFLWHPGASLYSGYGVTTMEPDRKDRLVGLLMVDRPMPVNPKWLKAIEDTFGKYQLYAMVRSGEQGIACQMRIEEASLPYVRQLHTPLARQLEAALRPLLLQPPKPRLVLGWSEPAKLWQSRFDIVGKDEDVPATGNAPLFWLGQIVATPGALQALHEAHQSPQEFLWRHSSGDWGDLDEHDLKENDLSLKEGYRLFSQYYTRGGQKIWVITEYDRSTTTLLLPTDY